MTTVAWDGETIASDTLEVDGWGLKSECLDKIMFGIDFVCAGAGNAGQIMRWFNSVKQKTASDVLNEGFTPYEDGKETPTIMIVYDGVAYKLADGFFIKVGRGYHAIGSGRDYAIAAMHIGKSAQDAVLIASELDNSTGGKIISHRLKV